MGIIIRETSIQHLDEQDQYQQQEFQFQTFVNSRGWQGIRESLYFIKVNAPIYPIAMKYDSRFGDAFWNSSEQSYFRYLLQMMTSWAMICHVWYLPLMTKEHLGAHDATIIINVGASSANANENKETMATETAPTTLNNDDNAQNDTDELID
ncbi:hypothetical protein niasHS_015588 [Heterodera schachtii]|uniref:Uncharacterized protein n=1 Tax=Heterodera schachtii TaxID=97005 RepID=A0ABD2HQT6_HETSC